MACCIYKSGFQFSENNPIFIITSLKRRGLRLIGGISFLSSQIFKSRWSELINISIKTEWAATCTCICLIFGLLFSILGTLEWELACLPHLGSFYCNNSWWLFLHVFTLISIGWWKRDSSCKETNYFLLSWQRLVQSDFFWLPKKGFHGL